EHRRARHTHRVDDAPTAEPLDIMQRRFGIRDLDVERDARFATRCWRADPAIGGAVIARQGHCVTRARRRQLPPERLAVEALQRRDIAADDLKEDYRVAHAYQSPFESVGCLSPPAPDLAPARCCRPADEAVRRRSAPASRTPRRASA